MKLFFLVISGGNVFFLKKFSSHYHQRENENEDFFAVYDGHGGREASSFASQNLHRILAAKLDETGVKFCWE